MSARPVTIALSILETKYLQAVKAIKSVSENELDEALSKGITPEFIAKQEQKVIASEARAKALDEAAAKLREIGDDLLQKGMSEHDGLHTAEYYIVSEGAIAKAIPAILALKEKKG